MAGFVNRMITLPSDFIMITPMIHSDIWLHHPNQSPFVSDEGMIFDNSIIHYGLNSRNLESFPLVYSVDTKDNRVLDTLRGNLNKRQGPTSSVYLSPA